MNQPVAMAGTKVIGYGLFAFPLAMAALPIYLHAPRFYVETTTLGLATVGLLFGLARLIDALSDPLLGTWIDRHFAARGRRLALPLALPLLAIGMVGLFHPPSGVAPGPWLVASVVIVSLGYSLASIAYQAVSADLHTDPHQRTRLAATREGVGLVGILAAALLPGWLAGGDEQVGLGRFSFLFVCLAVTGLLLAWPHLRPASAPAARSRSVARSGIKPRNQKSSETVKYVDTANTSQPLSNSPATKPSIQFPSISAPSVSGKTKSVTSSFM